MRASQQTAACGEVRQRPVALATPPAALVWPGPLGPESSPLPEAHLGRKAHAPSMRRRRGSIPMHTTHMLLFQRQASASCRQWPAASFSSGRGIRYSCTPTKKDPLLRCAAAAILACFDTHTAQAEPHKMIPKYLLHPRCPAHAQVPHTTSHTTSPHDLHTTYTESSRLHLCLLLLLLHSRQVPEGAARAAAGRPLIGRPLPAQAVTRQRLQPPAGRDIMGAAHGRQCCEMSHAAGSPPDTALTLVSLH